MSGLYYCSAADHLAGGSGPFPVSNQPLCGLFISFVIWRYVSFKEFGGGGAVGPRGPGRTVSPEQCLRREEGGLEHVSRLHDQHVLQTTQILQLQTLVGLDSPKRGCDGWMDGWKRRREDREKPKRGERGETNQNCLTLMFNL